MPKVFAKSKTPVAKTAPKPRVAPDITDITDAVEMPKKASNRGSKSLYPFDQLEINQSFGVKNKTAAGIASIVSNQNRKHCEEKVDENGDTVFETKEVKGVDGTVTEVSTGKPVIIVNKHFFAIDCNPKTDPHDASVRVFRDK